MTACVNKNHGRRVAGVVTASLVGALTLGGVSLAAVPTVALAEQAGVQAVAKLEGKATLTSALVVTGVKSNGALEVSEQAVSVARNGWMTLGKGETLALPSEVTPASGDPVELDGHISKWDNSTVTSGDYKVTFTVSGTAYELAQNSQGVYVLVANGTKLTTLPSVSDKVVVTVEAVKDTSEGTFKYGVKQASAAAEGAKVYSAADKSDDGFTYNGSAQQVYLSLDGAAASGSGFGIYASDGSKLSGTKVTKAGTYTAVASDGTKVTFEVKKLELSGTVSIDDTQTQYSDADTVLAALNTKLAGTGNSPLVRVAGTSTSGNVTVTTDPMTPDKGAYSATVTAKADDENVTGSVKVTWNVVDNVVVDGRAVATYDDQKSPYTVNLSKGQAYDASKFVLSYDNGATGPYVASGEWSGDDLVFTYKNNSNNKVVTADALKTPGSYTVSVKKAEPLTSEAGKTFSITANFTIEVSGAEVKDDGVLITFDGEMQAGNGTVSPDYDGTDQLAKASFTITDTKGNELVEGTDYKVVWTDAKGNEVTEGVNVDKYTAKIVPLTFEDTHGVATSNTLTVDVQKVQAKVLKDLVAYTYASDSGTGDSAVKKGDTYSDESLVYDGNAQSLTLSFLTAKNVPAAVSNVTPSYYKTNKWGTLDPSLYTVSSIRYTDPVTGKTSTVSEVKEVGSYKVTVKLTDEAAKNLALADNTVDVNVRKAKSFADVSADKWYAGSVEKAFQNFYINGTSGTVLFSPEAQITRADAVGILYNMAGGDATTEDLVTDDKGYATGFSDVDGHAYYARALAWAHKVGVANGYGDGTFGPSEKLTREQFAGFLMNYAKATGKYTAPTEDKLSGLSDASGVSSWAKEAVNWAVSNKVMGNGGYVAATSDITRAEVAAMGVNFQPTPYVTEVGGTKVGERTH